MSLISLPSALRATPALGQRAYRLFHTSSSARASVLFALSSLSNSRETQHFNKLTRLSRVEHSPPLKLIKSSEVDPFPLPDPPACQPRRGTRPVIDSASALAIWEEKALKVGRVILADQARRTHRLHRAVSRMRRREAKRDALANRDKLAWQRENQKLRNDMRAAGMWILLSIGTATALATWRFWPDRNVADSGDLGRKIAARASAAMPLPPAVTFEPSPIPPTATVEVSPSSNVEKSGVTAQQPLLDATPRTAGSGWKSLFWKQQ